MKANKLKLGLYLFGLVSGVFSGLCFSKVQYYKGKGDAYEETNVAIKKVIAEVNDKIKEEEGQQCLFFSFAKNTCSFMNTL